MTSKKVQKIKSNNNGEFISHAFHCLCSQQGIACQFSTPNTPQQNGVVERKKRAVQEMAPTMSSQSDLQLLPNIVAEMTPEEAFTGVKTPQFLVSKSLVVMPMFIFQIIKELSLSLKLRIASSLVTHTL